MAAELSRQKPPPLGGTGAFSRKYGALSDRVVALRPRHSGALPKFSASTEDEELFAPPGVTTGSFTANTGFTAYQTFPGSTPNSVGWAGTYTVLAPGLGGTGTAFVSTATIQPPTSDKGDTMSDPTREEIDAKLAAIDAKNDARFERMIGEMRTSQADLSGRIVGAMGELRQELNGEYKALKAATAGRLTVILTGVTSTLAILAIVTAIIFGLAASGQAMFGLGQSTHEIAAAAATAAAERVIASQPKK